MRTARMEDMTRFAVVVVVVVLVVMRRRIGAFVRVKEGA